MSKWTIYQIPTKEEQVIFKQLIGDAFETEALLVSTLVTKDFTEYIFIYNHPTEEMNNLVSFYGKVKKKKSKELELLEFATAQLTEKMILRNVNDVEKLEDLPVEAKVANSIKFIDTNSPSSCKANSSQFKYGLYKEGRTDRIGSFSCVIKDQSNNYRIVTSKHNCLEDGNYYLKAASGTKINLHDRKHGTLDYATFSINPTQNFIVELLGLEISGKASQDKITAFEKQCENISTGTNGDSGGNLHTSTHKYYGVYNSKEDLTKNVHIDVVLGNEGLTRQNYIG